MRRVVAAALALAAGACAAAAKPPVAVAPVVAPAPPSASYAQKLSWILRLEDQRVLRDSRPDSAVLLDVSSAPILPPPDLIALLRDEDARIRRRAALAVGRVGLTEGVAPLTALLADEDVDVRQMAAFASGLLGDARARDSLVARLGDPSLLVRGSAAEALGLIGDAAAAGAIARMAGQLIATDGFAAAADAESDDRNTTAAAFRLALTALVRLKAYDALAEVAIDPTGQPRVHAWPLAFALQRLEDRRALTALLTLARDANPYTRAFAVKGLGALKDRSALPVILPLLSSRDRASAIEAVRALGRIADPSTVPALVKAIQAAKSDPDLRAEAVAALGAIAADGVFDTLLDVLVDPSPVVRAAALRSLSQVDPQAFVLILSGLDPDPDWRVRAALATALAALPPERVLPRLRSMLNDNDQRVVAATIPTLVKLEGAEAAAVLFELLKADDVVVRAAAAAALAELKPAGGVAALTDAYRRGTSDAEYTARAAALAALAKYGAADATPILTTALQEKDWAVRLRAAALLKELDPGSDAALRIRPAPTTWKADGEDAARVATPPVSTQITIETDRGTIQLELAVLDAPLTVENFVALARKGFFDGLAVHRVVPNFVIQAGDPRGDSEGGPGYTIRDELNQRPYLRGTVGMALDWADTGGSQFFIALSPQPHLDAKYTVFGRVIAGMDVVDAMQLGDVIRRVRVWDGT